MLAKPEEAPYEAKDLRILLDRVAATMARMPSQRVRRALIEHSAKRQAYLGDTMARLSDLGTQNLSDDPGTVELLLASVKANLPFRLLGVTLRQNDQNLVHAVEALGVDAVAAGAKGARGDRLALRADRTRARSRTRVLSGLDKVAARRRGGRARRRPRACQGDLEVFGLPALLQSLSDSGVERSPHAARAQGGRHLRRC